MKFSLDHNNINVADLDRSVAFYEKALGMRVVGRIEPQNGDFRIAFLADDSTGRKLEITWLRDHNFPYELGDNESHIAFRTDDFEAAHKLHEEMGCICYENTAMGLYFIHDPDDYWTEILPAK